MFARPSAALAVSLAVPALAPAGAGFTPLRLANNTVDTNWTVLVTPNTGAHALNPTVVDRAGFPLPQGWAPTNAPNSTGGLKGITPTTGGFDVNSPFAYGTSFVMPAGRCGAVSKSAAGTGRTTS